MNEMNKGLRCAFALLAAALMLAGCGSQPSGDAPGAPPLAGARIGAPFTLTNQDGRSVKDTDFAGRYRMVYFGYTFCPDVCPVDVQKLMQGYRLFEKEDAARAAKLQPIFITVDPARDTPAALKSFVDNFHPKLIGLTGSADAIAAVAKGYAVYYRKAEGSSPDAYLMDHSNVTYLMGPDGAPIALVPQDGTPEEIAQTLKTWVR